MYKPKSYLFLSFAMLISVATALQLYTLAMNSAGTAGGTNDDTSGQITSEICAGTYEPVCGKDGITYANECIAQQKNIPVSYKGECQITTSGWDPVCDTVQPYDPVCGKDGITYASECIAKQKNIPVSYKGKCKKEPEAVKCSENCNCDNYGKIIECKEAINEKLKCKDTDGGRNYFQKGDVIFEDTTIGNNGSKSDVCADDTHLSEYVCENGYYLGDKYIFCPGGCKDGACIGNNTITPVSNVKIEKANPVSTSLIKPVQVYDEGYKNPLPPAGYEDEVITNTAAYTNPFPDTDINTLQGKSAAELYRRGVLGGFPDGEFKSGRLVNRAETAKFLLLAKLGVVEDMKNDGKFPDVADAQWYTKFVVKAAQLGIISGNPDGAFRPANNVNTAEFLKMLTRTFNLDLNLPYTYADVNADDWFAQYAGVAQKYNLFPDRAEKLEPARQLTRAEVAVAIYQYLSAR